MIVGLGLDLVSVARMKSFIQNKPQSLLLRVFTQSECDYSFLSKNCYERFAVRFAAKEAFFKAFGSGVLSEIEVRHDSTRKPFIQLSGKTKKQWLSRNSPEILLSVSHTKEYATASVLIQQNSSL